jgi:hypothetical protein
MRMGERLSEARDLLKYDREHGGFHRRRRDEVVICRPSANACDKPAHRSRWAQRPLRFAR